MTTSNYAILNAARDAVVDVRPYDDAWYQALVAANNPKAQGIRPVVVDAQPTLLPTQKAERGPYVIEASRVRATWVVSNKTQAEIDFDARIAERDVLISNISLFLDSAAPVTAAEAFIQIQRLKRLCKWLFEQSRLQGTR